MVRPGPRGFTGGVDTTDRAIDAVLFDFGGVFIGSPFEALARMGAEKGVSFAESLDIVFGPYDEDTDHPWHRAERGELGFEDARNEIKALAAERGHDLDLLDIVRHLGGGEVREEMVACVRRVREAGCVTAIVTNNIVEARDFWRSLLPLDELFDVVVDSSEVGVRKPDRRIYELALAELGGPPPARSAFLDDYAGNVRAADELGLVGILVESDPTPAIAALERLVAGDGR